MSDIPHCTWIHRSRTDVCWQLYSPLMGSVLWRKESAVKIVLYLPSLMSFPLRFVFFSLQQTQKHLSVVSKPAQVTTTFPEKLGREEPAWANLRRNCNYNLHEKNIIFSILKKCAHFYSLCAHWLAWFYFIVVPKFPGKTHCFHRCCTNKVCLSFLLDN